MKVFRATIFRYCFENGLKIASALLLAKGGLALDGNNYKITTLIID